MSMQRPHKAYPITGTICSGVAAHLEGTVVHEKVPQANLSAVRIGHPAGVLRVDVALEKVNGDLRVQHAIVERTARRLLGGYAHLPDEVS
jgi:2-methylaconitate cis-trans-isomerase PrpF